MSTGPCVSDHFDNMDEFEDVLDEAEAEAKHGIEEEFVSSMKAAWKDYGIRMRMSDKQAAWLKRISKT